MGSEMRGSSRTIRSFAGVAFVLALAPFAAAQSGSDYVIGPQDVLSIQVFDQVDLGGKYTVETDGTFSFPLVGRVQAGGLTLRGFEHARQVDIPLVYKACRSQPRTMPTSSFATSSSSSSRPSRR